MYFVTSTLRYKAHIDFPADTMSATYVGLRFAQVTVCILCADGT